MITKKELRLLIDIFENNAYVRHGAIEIEEESIEKEAEKANIINNIVTSNWQCPNCGEGYKIQDLF